MHRIDSDGNVSNLFTEGDPAVPQVATQVTDDWLNDVQEELCNAIEHVGITLQKGTRTQLRDAILAFVENLIHTFTESVEFSAPVLFSDTAQFDAKVAVTQALEATGQGADPGLEGTGSVTGSPGVVGTGTAGNAGVHGAGEGGGAGVEAIGGASGVGVEAQGGVDQPGVSATGGGSAPGVSARRGDGGSTGPAIACAGSIDLDGATPPASNVATRNELTVHGIVKAWGHAQMTVGSPSIRDGQNIASISYDSPSGVFTVTFAQPMADTSYAVFTGSDYGATHVATGSRNTGSFTFRLINTTDGSSGSMGITEMDGVFFMVLGAQ